MEKKKKRIVMGVGVVALIALIVYGFWPEPIDVEAARVSRGSMSVTFDEEGRTRVADRYVVGAPVAGNARRIELDVGDVVEQGDVLVRLDPLPSDVLDPRRAAQAEANLEAARAAIRSADEQARAAEVEAELAEADLERIRNLFEAGSATRRQLDTASSTAESARAGFEAARHAAASARADEAAAAAALGFSGAESGSGAVVVRAPAAGRILNVFRENAGVVQPGERLVEIGDPSNLEVVIDVLSADAVRLEPGTPVHFDRWGGDEPLTGTVRTVEPVGFTKVSALGVEEQRVNVIARFDDSSPGWARLGDGYRVEATFVLWEGEDVLHVPTSALFRSGDGWAVFRMDGSRARLVQIVVGERSGLVSSVLSGVEDGDLVVVHPDERLEDGARINVVETRD